MWDRCFSPFLLKTCSDEEIATSLCTLVLLLFYLGSILKSRVFLMNLSLSITMICFLQPNPKVINVVLHSASSSLSSINQTFAPEVLHASCLKMDFLPLVDYSLSWTMLRKAAHGTWMENIARLRCWKDFLFFISLLSSCICGVPSCLVLVHLIIPATYNSLVLQTAWMQSPFMSLPFCGRWFYKIPPFWSNVRNKLL